METAVAIKYEKIAIKGTNRYLLKPIEPMYGEYDAENNTFLDEGEEIYASYNDIKSYDFDEDDEDFEDEVFGHAVPAMSFGSVNGEELDSYTLMERHYTTYADDILIAELENGKVKIRKVTSSILSKFLETYNRNVSDIAIIYRKEKILGAKNTTYMLRPKSALLGNYNKDEDKFITDESEYLSMMDETSLNDGKTEYFSHVIKITDLVDDMKNEDLDELASKYFCFYEPNIAYAVLNDGKLSITEYNVSDLTYQNVDQVITDNDTMVLNELAELEKLLNGKITDEISKKLYDKYRELQRFLYLDGEINGVVKKDVISTTILVATISSGKIKNILDGSNLKFDLKGSENTKTKVNDYDPNKPKFPKYSFDEMYKGITDVVIGQDEQVATIVSVLYKRLIELNLDKNLPSQFGMMITGGTGTGKSEIFKTFAGIVDLPIQFMDATQITAAGYVGRDIESYIQEIIDKCKGDKEKALRAIMILDEVDKIKANNSEGSKDVNGKAVQDLFLKFMDGTEYEVGGWMSSTTVNTSLMTPISIGAYSDVYNKKIQNNYGFNEKLKRELKIGIKDFVEYGMMDEFMGRHYIMVHLNDMNVPLLLRILNESSKSPLKIQDAIFNSMGVDVSYTYEYKKAVAEEAIKRKTGARALAGIVSETTFMPIQQIDRNRGTYNKLIFTEETVSDPKKYILRRD